MSNQMSVIRALLWKEWRQQRALFGILIGAGLLAVLSGFWWRPFYAVGLAATLVWGCGPILFASNVFAGETDAGTRDFLDGLPCSRAHVFRTEFAAAFTFGLIGSLLVLVPGEILLRFVGNDGLDPGELRLALLLIPAAVAFEILVASVMSSFGGTVMVTVLTSIVLTLGFGAVWGAILVTIRCTLASGYWWATGATLIGLAILAIGAEACHTERGPGMLLAACRAARTLLLPVVLFLTVGMGVWWWSSIPRNARDVRLMDGAIGSAASKSLILQFGRARWGDGGRTAILNVHTGTLRTLFRLWESRAMGTTPWAPDGSKCLFIKTKSSILPFLPSKRNDGDELWMFHTDTGDCEFLSKAPWVVNQQVTWLDDRTLAGGGWKGIRFLHVDDGTESFCDRSGPLPVTAQSGASTSETPWEYRGDRLVSRGVGVFMTTVCRSDGSPPSVELTIDKHHPSLATSETRAFSLPADRLYGMDILPDGDTFAAWNEKQLFLARFRDGTWERTSLPSAAGDTISADLRRSYPPQGRTGALPSACFVTGEDAVYVYRLGMDSWDTWVLPDEWRQEARSAPARHLQPLGAFPSPDGKHLAVRQYLDQGHIAVLSPTTGEWSPLLRSYPWGLRWFGNDHLVVRMQEDGIWLFDRDMGKRRRVFPR